MAYTKYSLTPANNTATPPDGAPEGMLPSAVNDTMRDMMAQIRDCGDGIRDGTYTMTAAKITGGTITGITDLAIADGGTGASTAAGARTNLGLDGFVNMKNRIINGAMVIDQRNAGASVTATDTGVYPVDRFIVRENTDGSATTQRSTVVPTGQGFINSIVYTVTGTDSSLSATQFVDIAQRIEGLNVSDLGWGSASAKTITISFWVRSSVTGTYVVSPQNSAFNRSYPATYTINSADTWEYKTITIPGDTSGTWLTDNGVGMFLSFTLASGTTYQGTANTWNAAGTLSTASAVNLMATNGATFYITGVQFEVGSNATSFDYRPYGTELALCQRYFFRDVVDSSGASYMIGIIDSSTKVTRCFNRFPVAMRTAPTATYSGSPRIYDASVAPNVTSISLNFSQTWGSALEITASGGGLTVGRTGIIIEAGSGATSFSYSSEL